MESIHAGLQMMLDRGELLKALRAFKRGDFSVRMPMNLTGVDGEIAQAFNDVVELEEAKAAEIARVADQVGKEGQLTQRMNVPGAIGGWAGVIGGEKRTFAGHWCQGRRPPGARRVAAPRRGGEHDGGPAERVRLRGGARGEG